jgi:hypothetical protein
MPFRDELNLSLDVFLENIRRRVEAEPDIEIDKMDRQRVTHMCSVTLRCGETRGDLMWLEERWRQDQVGPHYSGLVDALRRIEAKRVEDREILMGTMARFYVGDGI